MINQKLKQYIIAQHYSDIRGIDFVPVNHLSASSRNYYRIKTGTLAHIICVDNNISDKEIEKYKQIDKIFKNSTGRIPELINFNLENKYLIWEDLGEISLQHYLNKVNLEKEYEVINQNYIIPFLLSLQEQNPANTFPVFGLEKYLFEWEFHVNSQYISSYLKKMLKPVFWEECLFCFLKMFCQLMQARSCLIHRDFQSSNIFIRENVLNLIDAQDMRIGHPLYDAVSWYFDSYVPLNIDTRFQCLEDFIHKNNKILDPYRDEAHLLDDALILIIQRKLHDAGAFVFANEKIKEKPFEAYILPALEMAYHAALKIKNEICIKLIRSFLYPDEKENKAVFLTD